MEIITQTIIETSLQKAISYTEYRTLVANLLAEGKSTGPEQTEELFEYSKLNDRRMHRLDKTVKLSEAAQEKIKSFTGNVTWLVITEGWCGDAAQNLPVIEKAASLHDDINLKLVLRDENLELMDAFLTNGTRSIPKLIMIDNHTKNVLGTWGPRPTEATKMVKDFKEAHGQLTPEFKQDLQVWYNKNKGESTIEDLLQLLALV